MLQSLSEDFDLHVFDHPDAPRSPIVAWTADADSLVIVLRGELDLISAEEVVHRLADWEDGLVDPGASLSIDVRGVTRVRSVARRLFASIQADLTARGVDVDVIGALD